MVAELVTLNLPKLVASSETRKAGPAPAMSGERGHVTTSSTTTIAIVKRNRVRINQRRGASIASGIHLLAPAGAHTGSRPNPV